MGYRAMPPLPLLVAMCSLRAPSDCSFVCIKGSAAIRLLLRRSPPGSPRHKDNDAAPLCSREANKRADRSQKVACSLRSVIERAPFGSGRLDGDRRPIANDKKRTLSGGCQMTGLQVSPTPIDTAP